MNVYAMRNREDGVYFHQSRSWIDNSQGLGKIKCKSCQSRLTCFSHKATRVGLTMNRGYCYPSYTFCSCIHVQLCKIGNEINGGYCTCFETSKSWWQYWQRYRVKLWLLNGKQLVYFTVYFLFSSFSCIFLTNLIFDSYSAVCVILMHKASTGGCLKWSHS